MTNNKSNKVDVYLEENCGDYNLYFHYNDCEFCLLDRDHDSLMFAINFKWRYLYSNTAARQRKEIVC